MAKVLEGPGMGLLKKWGMTVPDYVVVTSIDQFEMLAKANDWLQKKKLVVKAHEAIGSRFKLGLVKINLDLQGAKAAIQEMLGKSVGGGMTVSQAIISEMVPHKEEYYIAVKSVREGAEILLADFGGIEVEANWDRIRKLFIPVGETPSQKNLDKLAADAGFKGDLAGNVSQFATRLFQCYDSEDGNYMEINPMVVREGTKELIALDSVTLVDGDARYRHPDWNFTFASEFGRPYSEDERAILDIDSRVKGSVKFIEIPGGNIGLLPAGGGASVFYTDAVIAQGGKPANYAEYSGDPPDWAVSALTDKVCSLPGIEHIIVGGAIANFTNVKKTFAGIIQGFRKAKSEGKLDGVKIWVRRGGPFEKEGLDAMRTLSAEGFDIHVYDRNTPLTDIVDYALQGEN
ncbi:MAG TPA: ATP citrate lyase citrate-binding domain-containing protein [Nitrospiria bacterium]|nr:ATP citrate lyase citrate-binding domain-containing protein [Nitrospiria bacterium]